MVSSSNLDNAISVAVAIARDHGIRVETPIALRSTNNVVAWLYPAPIVAKVGIGRNSRLDHELRVVRELAALAAPVVVPAPEMPEMVHLRHGLEVTFWRYHAQNPSAEIPALRIAAALRHLHQALARISATLKASLPSYMEELRSARALLADPHDLQALPAPERELLATTCERLQAEMTALATSAEMCVLHGSPHSYNVLLVDGEARFIDFETACTGPVEWDLAHIDQEGELGYGLPTSPRLLWVCRAMASVKTAMSCWADVERGDLREHAEWHLSLIRGLYCVAAGGVAPK